MTRKRARHVISATAAAKNFGRLVDRVRSERAEFLVERGGAPAVRIVPAEAPRCSMADFVALLRSHANPGEAYLKALENGVRSSNKPAVPENRWER